VFSKFGALKLATVSVSTTGRSKGFGTVAFNRQQDAKAAIDALNDTDFNGRQMVVRVDHYAE
jgi:polyadenylate-binding protein